MLVDGPHGRSLEFASSEMNDDLLEKIKSCIAGKAEDFFGAVTLKMIYRAGKLVQISINEEETLKVQGGRLVQEGK